MKNLIRRVRKLLDLNRKTFARYRERQRFHRTITNPAAFWAGFPERLFAEHEPVFVLSTGRCGTELLTHLFELVPGVECYHQPAPELLYAEKKCYEEGREKFDAYRTAVRTARFELIMDSAVRGRRYIETNYRITFFAPHLHDLFPRSRFIHLVRHPADFVHSGVRLGYYEGLHTDIGRITPVSGPTAGRWAAMTACERVAWLWNETNDSIERFKAESEPGRTLTVKSEDLFASPTATREIMDFCRLPMPPESRVAARLRRPVNVKAGGIDVPPWANWDDERKASVRRLVPLAAKYGYEL